VATASPAPENNTSSKPYRSSSSALKATRPSSLTEASKPTKLNRPGFVRAITVGGPPPPRRIASPPASRDAAKETWPTSFIDGLRPRKSNRASLSTRVVSALRPASAR